MLLPYIALHYQGTSMPQEKQFYNSRYFSSRFWGQILANRGQSDWAWCQQHLRLVRHKIYCTRGALGKCKIMAGRVAGIFIQYEQWNSSVVFHNRLKLWSGEFFKILQDTFSFVTVIWKMRRRSAVVVVMIMNGSFVWKKNCLKECPSLFVCKKHILKDGTTEVLICWPGMQISQLSLELSVYHLRWEIGELFIWRRKRFCIPVLIYRFLRVYDTKWLPSE